MESALVVYFSQGGTTARVAAEIAAGLRAEGWAVDLHNLKDGSLAASSGYGLLGVGSPVYYFRPPFNVMDYVEGLPALGGLPAFVFVVHGTYCGDGGNAVRRGLAGKGAREVGYFRCRGVDMFAGYLKEGYLFSPDHPTAEELGRARAFGREVACNVADNRFPQAAQDPPPGAIYRLERWLIGRWLVRHAYSRLFRVDAKKCKACGTCVKRCPTHNIVPDGGGHPHWGRECLFCLYCELHCPNEAITSPASWPLFRPFMVYNTRRAARDPLLDHRPVVLSHGRVRPA